MSVIIPVYNGQDFIEETVRSVIDQSWLNWELLILDDGSSDSTYDVVKKYYGPKIRIMQQENQGVAIARNNGFRESKGDYIAFLDADDLWLSDNLERKVKFLQEHSRYGLVHSDAQIIDGSGKKSGHIKKGISGWVLDDLLLWETDVIPAPSSILIRREVIESIGGFDPRLSTAADQEFFFRLASKYPVYRIPEITWKYRIHGKNMHQNIKHMEEDHILAYKIAQKNDLFKDKNFHRKCLSNLYFIIAGSWWINARKHPRTFLFLFKSFFKSPSSLPRIISKLF